MPFWFSADDNDISLSVYVCVTLGWSMFCFLVGMSGAGSQKGINAVQRCSIANQKDAITMDFVQW